MDNWMGGQDVCCLGLQNASGERRAIANLFNDKKIQEKMKKRHLNLSSREAPDTPNIGLWKTAKRAN